MTSLPVETENLVRFLCLNADALYSASLRMDDKTLFHELQNPQPGDLVMEWTSFGLRGRDPTEGIGRLVSVVEEPVPRAPGDDCSIQKVTTIALVFLDGRETRWTNARFIKIKTSR